jgi:hypothetical protein
MRSSARCVFSSSSPAISTYGIPGVVHPHQRGGGERRVRFGGRRGGAEGVDQRLALGRERRREGDAERVLGREARTRDHAVEIEADVLRVVGDLRLDRGEEFHGFVLLKVIEKKPAGAGFIDVA